jgi:hypothetical protein
MEIAQLEGLRKQPRFFIEGVKNVPALSGEPPAYRPSLRRNSPGSNKNSHSVHMRDRFLLQEKLCGLYSPVGVEPALHHIVAEKIG